MGFTQDFTKALPFTSSAKVQGTNYTRNFNKPVTGRPQGSPVTGATIGFDGSPVSAAPTKVEAPKGDAMTILSPQEMAAKYGTNPAQPAQPAQPTIDPVGEAKSKEWELLRKRAAGNIALAASESDIAKAERLQATHEQAYRSGTEAGTRAYGAMEQRALDEAGQVRMGAMNEAYAENTQAELAQTSKDVTEEKALADEQYRATDARLQAEFDNPLTTKERKAQIVRERDNNDSQHFGKATGSWTEQFEATQSNPVDANSAVFLPYVQSAFGAQDPKTEAAIAKAVNINGLTSEEIGSYKGFLSNPKIIANPNAAKEELARFESKDYTNIDWNLVTQSPEWKKNKGQYVTHLTEPTGSVALGDTIMLGNYTSPLVVTENPSGEGFYARNLSSGKEVWVEDWSIANRKGIEVQARNMYKREKNNKP